MIHAFGKSLYYKRLDDLGLVKTAQGNLQLIYFVGKNVITKVCVRKLIIAVLRKWRRTKLYSHMTGKKLALVFTKYHAIKTGGMEV